MAHNDMIDVMGLSVANELPSRMADHHATVRRTRQFQARGSQRLPALTARLFDQGSTLNVDAHRVRLGDRDDMQLRSHRSRKLIRELQCPLGGR
jgi:hypothetical protein